MQLQNYLNLHLNIYHSFHLNVDSDNLSWNALVGWVWPMGRKSTASCPSPLGLSLHPFYTSSHLQLSVTHFCLFVSFLFWLAFFSQQKRNVCYQSKHCALCNLARLSFDLGSFSSLVLNVSVSGSETSMAYVFATYSVYPWIQDYVKLHI